MKTSIERQDFSARLQQALRNEDYSPESPTQLAREFNVRFPGKPITVHAARKWIVGEAIPTQEKLRTLASWLGVSAEWLRFGGDASESERHPSGARPEIGARFESDELKLISDLQRLDENYRVIARELIRMLVHLNQRK
jgi:hypothetical protein